MEDQRIDLVETFLAESGISPRNVGMVPNLWPGIALAPNEHARHNILGEIRFHLPGVHMLYTHQDHQRDIQRHVPGQARSTIGVFARSRPPFGHHLAECRPWQGAFELQQRMVVIHIDLDDFVVGGCPRAAPRRTMSAFFHGVLLI
jgi:hypothetical protein